MITLDWQVPTGRSSVPARQEVIGSVTASTWAVKF
jgi:hypothetical protein